MIYADLPSGGTVFLDASVFIHHFEPNVQAIQGIPLFAVGILSIDPSWLDLAAEASQQTGLLHNDALIITAMRIHRLPNLARADSDFDGVTGITRYGPL